jgi:predicted ATP-grasp superfamily ATP-dependent carboligase
MTLPPQVFVHEFVTGGGWPLGEVPFDLASEAAAMLQAVLADFRTWGAVRTVTTLDRRLGHFTLPADEVVCVTPGQHASVFAALLDHSDAALIIAPETDGVLARLSAIVEEASVPLLSCSSAAVAIASDKAMCYDLFRQANLPTPMTRRTSLSTTAPVADQVGYPVVIKPIDGVGCAGVCLVREPAELAGALALLQQATSHDEIILQSFVAGVHASVSLLAAEEQSLPLSLNGQTIQVGCPFVYQGGEVPLSHPLAARAVTLAQSAIRLIPGLRGYVGVDLILTQDQALLIEINPRLTTSYIGLRQVLDLNLAQAIWDARYQNVLPSQVRLNGQVFFTKDQLRRALAREAT